VADLPSELRTLVDRYGAQVLDDADGLRAILNDFLDEDISPGDVNLLVDAIRFGALTRLRALLDQGAEPDAVIADVAGGLAERRGGDTESAAWACEVLGYAAYLLPADRNAERQVGSASEFSTTSSPYVSGADDTLHRVEADSTNLVGQFDGALSQAAGAPGSSGITAPGSNDRASANQAHDARAQSTRRVGKRWAVVGTAVLVLVAGIVAFLLLRPEAGEDTAMHEAGHDVAIESVTVRDTFGHFGTPSVMNQKLESPCTNAALEGADYQEYKCVFKDHPDFYIHFNNGDPRTKDAEGELPTFVTHPRPKNLVTVQPPTPNSPGATSLHAYVMRFRDVGADGIRDTGDDEVELTLYDVDTKHAGSAAFESVKPNSQPVTRAMADELLQSIGASEDQFPLPRPFQGSMNAATGTSPLQLFAGRFLGADQLKSCVEGFLVVAGESEHVTCFASEDPKSSPYIVNFGLQRANPGLRAAQRHFPRDPATAPVWSWSDADGARGSIVRSDTLSGSPRLFWYADTTDESTWGLLTAHDASFDDLLQTFKGFDNQPRVVRVR
jgi:hypothetical protein